MPDLSPPFDLSVLERSIACTCFDGHVHHLRTTPSTNEVALKAALAGKRIGVWIADQQIAGRGRGGNTWHSPAGTGLYMTALVAPPVPMQSALSLSLRVAVAVQTAIVETTPFTRPNQIDIRWPNDLMLNGKKCGGILIDTASNPSGAHKPATLRYAVIGMGINLNQTAFPADLDSIATSLRRELPQPAAPFRREPLAGAILRCLAEQVRALASNPEPQSLDLSQFSTWVSGKRVRVQARDGVASYTGTTAGLNPQGFLLVDGDDGERHTILSGGLREP